MYNVTKKHLMISIYTEDIYENSSYTLNGECMYIYTYIVYITYNVIYTCIYIYIYIYSWEAQFPFCVILIFCCMCAPYPKTTRRVIFLRSIFFYASFCCTG